MLYKLIVATQGYYTMWVFVSYLHLEGNVIVFKHKGSQWDKIANIHSLHDIALQIKPFNIKASKYVFLLHNNIYTITLNQNLVELILFHYY